MYASLKFILAFAVMGGAFQALTWAGDEDAKKAAQPATASEPAAKTVERAISFLENDAAKWQSEKVCSTCHHGIMTVWSLSEAKGQGYAVDSEKLAETIKWTKHRFIPNISKPRDPRPGWRLVSVPGVYLGVMSHNLPILSRDELNRLAVHLARHQEEDGVWEVPPASNGAPPTWESRETIALWGLLAWEPYVPADPAAAAAASASREKTVAWLNTTSTTDTVQAAALRLLLDVRAGKPAEQLQPRIEKLFTLQNADGGWSQAANIPSDAYATGQTLWVLRFASVESGRSEIQRAVSFLTANQREDGSWPMTPRNHPGETRMRNPVPITYFGSAWATIGLVGFVPKLPDEATQQKSAIDKIRLFHGKYDVDESDASKPLIRVDLRGYDVDDLVLADFAKTLQVFPRLVTLEFKSPKITDSGVENLKGLPQLRNLTLENCAITDAGLVHLRQLTYLESLNLKGTQVTEAGVSELKQVLTKTKVER